VTAGHRVLVVEDDDTLRETLTEILLDEGFEVRSAEHGGDALEVLDTWTPHLIVLDVMMPEMDAFEFRRHQRHRPDATAMKILVVSAAANAVEAAGQLEADEWVAKPFSLREMLASVDRLLGRTA
jgi:DNA-binding response OmpR family regulator